MNFFATMLIAQYLITALSSGFNALYFWNYRSPRRGRRVGAVVLFWLSLALVIESLYFGLFALGWGLGWGPEFFLEPRRWLVAQGPVCLGSLAITALIVRKLASKLGER